MPITYELDKTASRINNPEFTFYIPEFLREFSLAGGNLHLEIYEDMVLGGLPTRKAELSQKEGNWTLQIPVHIYHDRKNRLIVPLPADLFKTLRFEISKAIEAISPTQDAQPTIEE